LTIINNALLNDKNSVLVFENKNIYLPIYLPIYLHNNLSSVIDGNYMKKYKLTSVNFYIKSLRKTNALMLYQYLIETDDYLIDMLIVSGSQMMRLNK
jgi:hypothetical protein